jgi:transposase
MRSPAAGEDRKFVVVGALDDASGQLLSQVRARKGEEAFSAFLDQLTHTWASEDVVVVLDNVGYHKSHALREESRAARRVTRCAKSHALREWWRAHAQRIHPFFLPAYAPHLNLIERLWRYLKDKLACHRWCNDRERLQQATQSLLDGLAVHFHATEGPAFQPVQNFRTSA